MKQYNSAWQVGKKSCFNLWAICISKKADCKWLRKSV